MIILEENFKWHLEAFATELFDINQRMLKKLICHIRYMIRYVIWYIR